MIFFVFNSILTKLHIEKTNCWVNSSTNNNLLSTRLILDLLLDFLLFFKGDYVIIYIFIMLIPDLNMFSINHCRVLLIKPIVRTLFQILFRFLSIHLYIYSYIYPHIYLYIYPHINLYIYPYILLYFYLQQIAKTRLR